MNWERRARGRWEAPGYEIRACVVHGKACYHALRQGARRTWLGLADAWHDTAAAARAWCEADQADVRINGRAG